VIRRAERLSSLSCGSGLPPKREKKRGALLAAKRRGRAWNNSGGSHKKEERSLRSWEKEGGKNRFQLHPSAANARDPLSSGKKKDNPVFRHRKGEKRIGIIAVAIRARRGGRGEGQCSSPPRGKRTGVLRINRRGRGTEKRV